MYQDKLPPHDIDAEEAVLGSCFIDPEAIHKIAQDFQIGNATYKALTPECFYREKNQWAFAAMLEVHKRGEPTNQIIVAHELAKMEKLTAIGGAAYISHCIAQTPTSAHVKFYAKIVREHFDQREQIRKGVKMIDEAYQGKKPRTFGRTPLY